MNRDELISKRRAAEKFCAEHITECVRELIEWQNTALLRDGKVRQLAALCTEYTGNYDGLRVAEYLIQRRACELVAAGKGSEAVKCGS